MHRLFWPFWNHHERRLRAGWRILIQLWIFMLWIFAPALINALVGNPIELIVSDRFPNLAQLGDRITLFGLTVMAVLFSTWLVVRFIDHRPISDLGLQFDRDWWQDLGFGLVLGAVLMTFVFLVEYSAGWIDVRTLFSVGLSDVPFAVAIIGPLTVFILVGITEEILSRGYQLRNLAEGLNFPGIGPRWAIVIAWLISSSFFGLLHVFNPNSTWISTVYLMLAGIFLGLGLVLTGRLGLPIGLHITWNFFMGNVYGFPVSGNDFSSTTVITIEQGGPDLWTGGAFGPEAGLLGIVAILLGGLLTILWVRGRYKRIELYEPLAYYRPLHQAGATMPNDSGGSKT